MTSAEPGIWRENVISLSLNGCFYKNNTAEIGTLRTLILIFIDGRIKQSYWSAEARPALLLQPFPPPTHFINGHLFFLPPEE